MTFAKRNIKNSTSQISSEITWIKSYLLLWDRKLHNLLIPSLLSLNTLLHVACCARYCASTYWSSRTEVFIFKEGNAKQERTLARGQARTHMHRLQVRLPPLRSHLAKTASQNEGTQAQHYIYRCRNYVDYCPILPTIGR